MIDQPSPNHDERPPGRDITILLVHYTGMPSPGQALERLCDPASRVSSHYLIGEDGALYRLVDESRRAWHAGVARWAGESDINGCSIGIELVNPGHEFGYRDFPEAQMVALEQLCRGILARHPIPAHRVLGHSDVAPGRKRDPGELFDWARLAAAGIGYWPARRPPAGGDTLKPGDQGDGVKTFQDSLARLGYGIEAHGRYDQATIAVVTAFQRHFVPGKIDGVADGETRAMLEAVLDGL